MIDNLSLFCAEKINTYLITYKTGVNKKNNVPLEKLHFWKYLHESFKYELKIFKNECSGVISYEESGIHVHQGKEDMNGPVHEITKAFIKLKVS